MTCHGAGDPPDDHRPDHLAPDHLLSAPGIQVYSRVVHSHCGISYHSVPECGFEGLK